MCWNQQITLAGSKVLVTAPAAKLMQDPQATRAERAMQSSSRAMQSSSAEDPLTTRAERAMQSAPDDPLAIVLPYSIGARRKIVAQLRRQEARATRPALALRSSSTASSEPSRRGEVAVRLHLRNDRSKKKLSAP